MSIRLFTSVFCWFVSLILTIAFGNSNVDDDTLPNIVFILADDMGYGDIGVFSVYPDQNSHYKLITPNIDQLAKDGIQFTDSYAGAPVCTPSRCALMTGRHLGHCTARDNGYYISGDDVTVADVLKSAGYDTAHFGKWGIGYYNDSNLDNGNDPNSKGFDIYVGQTNNDNCHNYYPEYQYHNSNWTQIPTNINATRGTCGKPDLQKCSWSGDLWANEAISYLSNPERKKNPFFMYFSFTTPHSGNVGNNTEHGCPIPRISEGPYYNQFQDSWPYHQIEYATAVTMVDEYVGLILDTLVEHDLTDNTIVFFASDNGANNEGGINYEFFASSGYLQGFKRSLHEGGWRTDFIVKWPGVTKPGQVSNYQWTFYDLLATVADLSNAQNVPDTDGVSLVPVLKGEDYQERDFVYTEYCGPNEYKSGWGQALRMQNYTGVCVGPKPNDNNGVIPVCNSTTFLLYDLTNDVSQSNNIADANPDVVSQIMTMMAQQHTKGGYCSGA